MKHALWPADYDIYGININSTFFKMAQTFFNNTIIVRLRYKSSEIEFTKLDVRTTMTDKIANFGGTFGIWAELTGVSLLGMINLKAKKLNEFMGKLVINFFCNSLLHELLELSCAQHYIRQILISP